MIDCFAGEKIQQIGGENAVDLEEFMQGLHEIENEIRDFLADVVEELQKEYGFNAFLAGSVPPFKRESKRSAKWEDSVFPQSELIDPDFNYIQQSRTYARVGDVSIFIFRYLGNPVGTTYEIADIFKGDDNGIVENSVLYYQSDPEREGDLERKFGEFSGWGNYDSNPSKPHYLSAMVTEMSDQYGEEIMWKPFENPDALAEKIGWGIQQKLDL
ncbi:hypothetical protein Har1131_07820 [Haloarcula sp. CBA1131]|nr:hypothetical protein Har1131_07820 [Haloarcula sp. CBA1131]